MGAGALSQPALVTQRTVGRVGSPLQQVFAPQGPLSPPGFGFWSTVCTHCGKHEMVTRAV